VIGLAVGALLILVGVFNLSFPELIRTLKANDLPQWEALGSPPPYAFHKTVGVVSWVLAHGYKNAFSAEIVHEGESALKKAVFAKYALITGVLCLVLGFIVTLS